MERLYFHVNTTNTTKLRVLFLDDSKDRYDDFVSRTDVFSKWVCTGEDFCQAVQNEPWDLFMLDHDLGLSDYDGSKAARYLAENRSYVGDQKMVIIHSSNSIGVANMMSILKHSDHLRVDALQFAWQRACMKNGNLYFRSLFDTTEI